MTAAAPSTNWNRLAHTLTTFTVNVCARAADGLGQIWPLTIVGVLMLGTFISLHAAINAGRAAFGLLRHMMSLGHKPLHHHAPGVVARHHTVILHLGRLSAAGVKQLASSLTSHPVQPAVILIGSAVVFGTVLVVLFNRGAMRAGSPQDGDGVFGLVTTAIGLLIFCALALMLREVAAAPVLSVTHNIVGIVINAA